MMLFNPKIVQTMKNYSMKKFGNDVVAGVIVAIIALPLSIALAIASGVSPEKGLYTAIIAGFIIALLGGSSVNISGPTAAFATIVAGIVATKGLSGLVVATVLAGVILIIMGVCHFGSLIKYIPLTITTGFTAGIAVTIVVGQIKDFLGLTYPVGTQTIETAEKLEAIIANITTVNFQTLLVGAVSLAILIIWPKISKKIPGSLIVVLLGAVAVKFLNLNVNTIGDLYQITSALPTPSIPQLTLNSAISLIPDAFTIAILAGIESLLSCVVSDGMINDKHDSNTELIAQGVGNIFSGIFGGIPATGAIARTAANVKNGGRSPVAAIVHAIVLLLILVILMPLAAFIPMPVIASILFMVAYNMSEWRRFAHICKTASKSDITVLVATFLMTVIFDLVVAISAGLILTSFLFLKKMADVASVRSWVISDKKPIPEHCVVYEISGPMFFAASEKMLDFEVDKRTKVMILRTANMPMLDSSAISHLEKLYKKCKRYNVTIVVSHINEQPLKALKKAGLYEKIGKENFCEHIDVAIRRAEKIIAQAE